MHVYFVVRHTELTDTLRWYVEHHLIEPILNHNHLKVTRVEIQLFPDSERRNAFACHVLVDIKGHHAINVREIGDDVFAAIDVAKDRVLRALTELRNRILTQRRHPKKYSFERIARALGWQR